MAEYKEHVVAIDGYTFRIYPDTIHPTVGEREGDWSLEAVDNGARFIPGIGDVTVWLEVRRKGSRWVSREGQVASPEKAASLEAAYEKAAEFKRQLCREYYGRES